MRQNGSINATPPSLMCRAGKQGGRVHGLWKVLCVYGGKGVVTFFDHAERRFGV
jgi:hypothetical protein